MTEFQTFGRPDRFEIACRWTQDLESRSARPAASGWSTGDLRITVANQILTARSFDGRFDTYLSWYIQPVLEWLADQWIPLLHEERYAWSDKLGMPASVSAVDALARHIGGLDEAEHGAYARVQSWWRRHALRAADPSALYPDVYFRRCGDNIEVSWNSQQPQFAPDGFFLTLSAGYTEMPVGDVAGPLWEFLHWGIETARPTTAGDQQAVDALQARATALERTPLAQLEMRHVGENLYTLLASLRSEFHLPDESILVPSVPAIDLMDAPVLMYGGLSPDITPDDGRKILQFLMKQQGGEDSDALRPLVDANAGNRSHLPHQEGYELAEDLRKELQIARANAFVNIHQCLNALSVKVVEASLETDAVRGVAVAGKGFSPAILVNTSSAYNSTLEGRRFTLAHELCHILFDRSRGRRLSHVSGPWTRPRIEKRANAFAAMFLASASALRQRLRGAQAEDVARLAGDFQISIGYLVEHLYNLDLIGDPDRERLRQQFASAASQVLLKPS